MSKLYKAWGLTGLLLAAAAPAVRAQFAYKSADVIVVAGAYADLGTAGTAIATANNDDANSTAQNIGFTFVFNGQSFTQFVLNTNGLLRMGGSAPSTAAAHSIYGQTPELGPINSTNAADVNLLLPFNFDLVAGSAGAEYRVATTGTAGSRVCTIQWKNVADKAVAFSASNSAVQGQQYNNFSFQVKLYEGSNQVDYVYNVPTAGSGAATPKFALVGMKGSRNTTGSDVLGTKSSLDDWGNAEFFSGRQLSADDANAFNFRSTVLPTAGFTYRFSTCSPAVVTAFPYIENFDAVSPGDIPCSTSVDDVNEDDYTLFVATPPNTSPFSSNALVYIYNDNDATVGADDWFFTPPLPMRVGYSYQLQFKYAALDASYPEGLEVKYGTAANSANQTGLLFSNSNITNDTYVTTTTVPTIVPTATGTYYIGFHAISAPDEYALLIDDVQVTESRILGVRNAANGVFTAEASPVPFGESLSLTLNTLASGPLHLTLRDALGRTLRQSTTAASAGTSTVAVPEAGTLPGGVYFLTVEQGGQSQVLRVSHR